MQKLEDLEDGTYATEAMKRKNEANLVLERHMRELKLYYRPEYRFYAGRRWRADYFLPRLHQTPVIIEIEGGTWARSRHTSGRGYANDCEKYSTASALGFAVFRFTTEQVLDGTAKEFLRTWLR